MKTILTINLDNEMDLIIVHKRAMKLAELCSISLAAQTIFATAVSEIARQAIDRGQAGRLSLGIVHKAGSKKQLCAVISDPTAFCNETSDAIHYAGRLVNDIFFKQTPEETKVTIYFHLPFPNLISDNKIQSFIDYFEKEKPISPYDELRRKNVQLQELAYRLHESESNYRQLTDSLPLMMFSLNTGGKVVYTNKWLKDFLGFETNQLETSLFQPFMHPEDYGGIYASWTKAKGTATIMHGQARLKNVDSGQYVWHLLSIIPLGTENSEVDVWNGFLVDIHAQKMIEQTLQDNTELKAIQKQLEQNQAELENKIVALNRSNHDLEQFAYIASHDLQEPLRKIRVFAELMQRNTQDQSAVAHYYSKIENSAQRMATLIQGVLAYSRISNSTSEAFVPVDLNKIWAETESDFENLIEQQGAVIEYSELPVVPGIALQLRQLFGNLLSNALKFSREKPVITLSAREIPAEEITAYPLLKPQRSYVKITLQDNGIGFDQEYGEKIFIIFQQLNSRMAYEGTGIGLALCKKVVERHQGVISAFGELGAGAVFEVVLPVD